MSEEAVVVQPEGNGLFGLITGLAGGVVRFGLTLISVPLVVLPRQSRRRVRRAIAEMVRAVVALPRELGNLSVRVVDDIFDGSGNGGATIGIDEIGERARNFTDRLVRAADDLTGTVGRAAKGAVDNAEKAAAKVDQWVEKA